MSFAAESATVRRGVLTSSVTQAMSITVPLGLPVFFVVALLSGWLGLVFGFSPEAVVWLALAGIVHFVWGRYCNYRATKAMGANLAAPVQQCSILVTLALAIYVLGEYLTPLRVFGIALVILGPALAYERKEKKEPVAAATIELNPHKVFQPKYAEGYFFGFLSTTGYGISPILVRLALESKGLEYSIAGGLISYIAATAAFALMLLWPGQWRHVRSLDRSAGRWFVVSGLCVCVAQMLRYMALSVAPVAVVAPIQRLSLVFRFYFARLINPQHEVFGGRVIVATIASLVGAVALSASTDVVQGALPLPEWAIATLNWRWP